MPLKGEINLASDLYKKLQVESERLEKEVTDHDFNSFVKTTMEFKNNKLSRKSLLLDSPVNGI